MKKIRNHHDIIEAFGGHKKLAEALMDGKACTVKQRGLTYELARNWYRRGQISCESWLKVEYAAKRVGLDIDIRLIAETK